MNKSNRVLVVEDDAAIVRALSSFLTDEGFLCKSANGQAEALRLFEQEEFDIVLLDVSLADGSGFVVCSAMKSKKDIPIIFLTASGDEHSVVTGLELGADDYVVKPFETKEVIARINAVLRRIGKKESSQVKEVHYENLSINLTNYELKVKGVQIDTPPKEMELIYHLASNPNRVFTRDQLLDEVWGFDYYGDSRTVDVHVKRLREKLEGVSDKWSLKTVWGVGYKFEVKE